MHHTPTPAPDLSSPDALNEAIRSLAAEAARVGEWTQDAREELDALYRRWHAAREREAAEDGEAVAA
jgi:hypothetical protein